MVKKAQEQHIIESFLRGQTVSVDILVHDFHLDAEFPGGILSLAGEFLVGFYKDTPFGATKFHLNGEETGVSSHIEHCLAGKVLRYVTLENLPPCRRLVG